MFRNTLLALPFVALVCPANPASAADFGYGDGGAPRYRHHHHGYGRIHESREAGAYRPAPAFFAGAGTAAPNARRVVLVEYREAYLPRGVLYNIPGPPTWASQTIIRAKY